MSCVRQQRHRVGKHAEHRLDQHESEVEPDADGERPPEVPLGVIMAPPLRMIMHRVHPAHS
jgi:hypothetical protein